MADCNLAPLVSIVLPVYNAEEYLGQCLDSLINQTYKNIEILCYNDGSKDNSLEILKEYAKQDNRILIFDNPNRGIAVVRNSAMIEAKGTYIMFSDADDWWELNAVEKALENILKYDADVVLFSYYRDYKDKTLKKKHIFEGDLIVFDEIQSKKLWRSFAGLIGKELKYPENFDSNNALWSKMYKTEIFKKHDEVRYVDNKTIGAGGDGLLNFFYFKYVKKAVYLSDCLYHYRKTVETSIVSVYKPDFVEKRFHLFDLYSQYIVENKLDESFRHGISNRIAMAPIGLGLHEIGSSNSLWTKYKNINALLTDKRYRKAVKTLDLTYMQLHWKLFFFCCKHKITIGVMFLLYAIHILKSLV